MKIVFVSNFFNHHQKPLSDCLYKLTGGQYWLVETRDIAEEQKKLGYHTYDVPYLLKYKEDTKYSIDKLIMDADVVQFGEAPLNLIRNRVKKGKLIARDDERRYKAAVKYLKWPIFTYNSLFFNRGILLCASAFAARDYRLSGMNSGRCYK